jgi:cation diffusion facilitator CzcD-associated flavoprotein CzcO
MLDWLIVGGGIHGTHLSRVLSAGGASVRVLDPHAEPLQRWRECTRNCGMQFLRSPLEDHLAEDPLSLFLYRRDHPGSAPGRLAPHRGRAALSVFNDHAAGVISRYGLRELRVEGRASGLARTADGVAVETTAGRIESKRVLLAMGLTEQLRLPPWIEGLPTCSVNHVGAPGFDIDDAAAWKHCVVVGGGMTAVQTAVSLANAGQGAVTLLSRGATRCHDFDTDSEWIRPAGPERLWSEPDFDRRRDMIEAGRYPGSVTADVEASLKLAVGLGRLTHTLATVERAVTTTTGETQLHIPGREPLLTDRLLLATGFDSRRPGGSWLSAAIEEMSLPTAACGYPIVDEQLAWGPDVCVAGALAELGIGPAALNIAGARFAGRRLSAVASRRR